MAAVDVIGYNLILNSSKSSLSPLLPGPDLAAPLPLENNNDDNDLIDADGVLITTSSTTTTTLLNAEAGSATVKPDIVVGFVFLGLSALLLLSIIVLCIYVQRPFKRFVRYYRHLERKRILAKMGVDEIHDLHYDAGFIPKTGKPGVRRNRLISQQFDAIIDLDADHLHPHHYFYQQHAALMAAKRISVKQRMGRGRWSQGAEPQRPAALFQPRFVHRNSSLPALDDPDVFAAVAVARDSTETTATATTGDTFPDSPQLPKQAPPSPPKKITHHHHHHGNTRLASTSDRTTDGSEDDLDDVNEVVLLSEATMGVESVSKNTPQAQVLQEMIAKSRAIAATRQSLTARISLPPKSPLAEVNPFVEVANRRRSMTTAANQVVVPPPSALKNEQVIGRFHVLSAAGPGSPTAADNQNKEAASDNEVG